MRPDEETPTRSAAELLREAVERDPEAHYRALARAYGVGPMWDEQDQARLVAAACAEHKRANDAEAARDRALAERDAADSDFVRVWGKATEVNNRVTQLTADLAAARSRIADLEATAERVNTVLDSWEKCPDSTLSWAATVFRNQLAQDTARDETGDPQ